MRWVYVIGLFAGFLAQVVVGQEEPLEVQFRLYPFRSFRNYYVALNANDSASLKTVLYRSNKPTKILCNGYIAKAFFDFPQDMKNAYLRLNKTYNVIVLEWDAYTTLPYNETAAVIPRIGKALAELMDGLINAKRATLGDFHFLGHSLGSHIGAFVSRNLKGGQLIPRITGLDPAGPGFEGRNGLDPTDAEFVDVIRTSNGLGQSNDTGPKDPVGTVDFYVNGGLHQPGCDDEFLDDKLIDNLCSHLRAYKYYTESLATKIGFFAYKCDSYEDYEGSCVRQNPAIMGEYVSHAISGSYYLDTNPSSPYAMGSS